MIYYTVVDKSQYFLTLTEQNVLTDSTHYPKYAEIPV